MRPVGQLREVKCGLGHTQEHKSRPGSLSLADPLHAANRGAIPFDAPRIPQIKLNHRGDRCTFEAIIEDYKLSAPGLERLALIVRAADIKGQEAAPEGMGLRAIAEGFAAMGLSDSERLRYGFAIYDALLQYAAAGSNQNIETTRKGTGL